MVFLPRFDQTKEAATAKNVPPLLAISIAMAVHSALPRALPYEGGPGFL